jgi:1,4-dihydroxy-2-naphthoate octaprenyltransferase
LIDINTVKNLRFPFSFFLMPVFIFALSQVERVDWTSTLVAFLVLHLFVFPSSNGYNTYQDKDDTSIGGLKTPPKVSKNLFYVTLFFDFLAIFISIFVSIYLALLVLLFISMSKFYSYRKIRLKKYPIISFLVVFIFQGAFVYLMALVSFQTVNISQMLSFKHLICMIIASFFIGSMYPLTQIYQHDADKKDGVISISYKLGYHGTFVFSAILFTAACTLLFYHFSAMGKLSYFLAFSVWVLPVIVYLIKWSVDVKKNPGYASFERTMKMNLLSSFVMNTYFVFLILNNFFNFLPS